MPPLTGRVAAITGASSGIGAACARRFARAGMDVVLCARRADRLQALGDEIARSGRRAVVVPSDVTREDDMRRLVDTALGDAGRLDVMVCNAGIGYHGLLADTPADVMERLLDVNVLGTFHAARAALAHFRAMGRGHVVIVSSIVGRRGIARGGAYAATKFAQVGLAESLRTECLGTSIGVSLVYPVSTDTELRAAMHRDYGIAVGGAGPRQSSADVAEAIVRCLIRPKPEVYPYPLARLLAWTAVLAPGACDRLTLRFARRRSVPGSAP